MTEVDSARSLILPGWRQGMRFLRHVENVAEAFDGDVGLLEFLPQADEAQERLAHPPGEHLEGDQHADRKPVVLHDQQGTDDQDGQGHHLFQAIGDDVVGIADLLGGEAGRQILGEEVAVLLVDVGFHLQGFDGGHTGDVFGQEGLVSRAEHELLVELVAKLRRRGQEIEDSDARPADRRRQRVRALFEVWQRQSEEVAENLAAEDGIDAVAGVQHEVLAQPAHAAGEEHEHDQTDTENDQGAVSLVNHDLVDDDLGEQRGGQTDELDGEAGEQDIAPDGFVFEEFGDEPLEAEFLLRNFEAGDFAAGRAFLAMGTL